MDVGRFKRGFRNLYGDPQRSLHPKDRRLARLIGRVPGFATENKLMLLNFAASLLEPGEIYLEIGTWQGLSLLGAMLGNADKEFFAIDNFSQFGDARTAFFANLWLWKPRSKLTFVEGDCFSILRSRKPFGDRRVGVYFYDGDHAYESQFRALQYVQRHLSPRALLIIDDTAYPWVRAATDMFMAYHRSYRLVLDLHSEHDREPRWWNGVQVHSYHARRA